MSDNLSNAEHQLSLNSSTKRTFAFSRPFDGSKFYNKYKNALFLENQGNIRSILSKTDELQKQYDEMQPNEEMVIDEMFVKTDVPLVLKKSATVDESDVNQDDFTLRRLCGLAAVVAFEQKYYNIYAVHSERYKLQKPYSQHTTYGSNTYKFKEYLAAVNGTEYFVDLFDYFPFLMALNKFNLQHIDASLLISIGNIRHPDTEEPMAARCYRSFEEADRVAKEDYGFDLKEVLQTAPKEVQVHFWILEKMENTGNETKKK